MTTLKRYEEKDQELTASAELEKRALAYMRKHPGVNYLEASNIVLEADPELARSYAGKDEKKQYTDPVKEAKTEHQRDLAKYAELEKKAKEYMADHPGTSYMEAADIVKDAVFV